MAGTREDNLIGAAVPNPVVGQTYTINGQEVIYGGTDKTSTAGGQSSPSNASSKNQQVGPDVAALIQRGVIQQPGFYGNQELKASNDQFNTATQIGGMLAGPAMLLKSAGPAPSDYVRTEKNYKLTQKEIESIENKSRELASFGVIPYDALEKFFYILASITSLESLKYIADTVNIPELANQRYIRNILAVLQIPNISNIGYLSQAVYSIDKRYANQYISMQQYDDPTRNSNSDTLGAAALGLSLGVIGASIIGTAFNVNQNPGTNYLKAAPDLSQSSITNAVNTYAGLAAGTLSAVQLASVTNPAVATQGLATLAGASAIASLLSQSPLGGALSSLGALGGIAAATLLGKGGGLAIGGMMSEVLTGKRIDTSTRAKNPMLTAPSYAGKSFFGEAPVSLPAIDQLFCRRVGAFGTNQGGTGVVSFGMQNFASMGGSIPISSMVSRMITGSPVAPPSTTFFGQQVSQMTTNLCSNMNVPVDSMIEMRRSDNAIPFMLGMNATMMGENFSPIGSKPIMQGWQLASSTANDIQKYNPQYLRACQTSL